MGQRSVGAPTRTDPTEITVTRTADEYASVRGRSSRCGCSRTDPCDTSSPVSPRVPRFSSTGMQPHRHDQLGPTEAPKDHGDT